MKKTKILLLAVVAAAALPLSAAQYVFIPGNSSIETRLCIAAAENNLGKYKRTARLLSSRKTVHQMVAKKLSCNEQSIGSFAQLYDADRTAAFIGKYSKHEVIIRREISDVSDVNSKVALKDQDDDRIIYITVN